MSQNKFSPQQQEFIKGTNALGEALMELLSYLEGKSPVIQEAATKHFMGILLFPDEVDRMMLSRMVSI